MKLVLHKSSACSIVDKLQHEMYWNTDLHTAATLSHLINYNMRCIETRFPDSDLFLPDLINYNMRCIETEKEEKEEIEEKG